MRRILVAIMMMCTAMPLATATPLDVIRNQVEAKIKKLDADINIGIKVLDLSNNKILYQRNAERAYTPASVLKLFTDAAALIDLGPDFRFDTQLLTHARAVNQGHLTGSLILKFSGDPSLTHQDLSHLLQQLKNYSIETIDGDIVIVGSRYGSQAYAPGWMLEDTAFSYASPVLPIILDKNELSLRIDPAPKPGQKASLYLSDPSDSVKLVNRVMTTDKKYCRIHYKMNSGNQLTVEGCIRATHLSKEKSIAIKNPMKYLKNWLTIELHRQGITLRGKMIQGKLPKNLKRLAGHQSPPLSQLMIDTLKPSDNLYADSLYLKVAEHFFAKPVTWRSAAVAVKRLLHRYARLNLKQAVIVDGSGLSRYNLVTPTQTVALLSYLYSQFPISYEFITALPVSGRDGTLQKRLLASESRGLVRAKTGTMLGVVSLAGYLPSANHHVLAFSIMINGIPGSSHASLSPYRQLADTLCDYFLHLKVEDNSLSSKTSFVKKALSHEKTLSYLNRVDAEKKRLNRLELSLRRSLNRYGLNISREGAEIRVTWPTDAEKESKASQKQEKAIIAHIAKAVKPYSVWVFAQSKNRQWNKQVRRKLPKPVLYSNSGDRAAKQIIISKS